MFLPLVLCLALLSCQGRDVGVAKNCQGLYFNQLDAEVVDDYLDDFSINLVCFLENANLIFSND